MVRKFIRINIILILSVIFLWWLRRLTQDENYQPESRKIIISPIETGEAKIKKATPPSAKPTPPPPDDFTLIEGIGPKISNALKGAGVSSFYQLASLDPDSIRQLLSEAGIKSIRPETWPEQAQLAAQGDIEKLAALQNRLKGGRRV